MSFLAEIVGSFSTGAAANPTVAMMEAAFGHEGLDWRYVNCEVPPDDLAAAVAGAKAMGWRGFNCSMPHKQAVIEHLDGLSETARITQAVNCVVATDDGWIGHNTDGAGFLASVLDVMPVDGTEVLLIGSGGAAFAIAVELANAGAAVIYLASRNVDTRDALATLLTNETAAEVRIEEWSLPLGAEQGVSLLVNATPVGMHPHIDESIPLARSTIGNADVAADVVPNPAHTTFLRHAAAAGLRTIDGTGMLVNQACENFRLWTGIDPDPAPMRRLLDELAEG